MLHIHENYSLKAYNTFGVECKAKQFIKIDEEQDLVSLFEQHANLLSDSFLVIGGGSNILLTQDFNGLVIYIAIKNIQYTLKDDEVYLAAGAGEVWNDLVQFAVANGFYGLENLSLIPGSVGASPVQNIGAYGVEVKDVFYSCKAFEIETGQFKIFYISDCEFSYRESVFKQSLKGKYIITEVVFKLKTNADLNLSYGAITTELSSRGIVKPTLADVSKIVSEIRVSKLPDPSIIGNAGSFFKNPIIGISQYNNLLKLYPNLVAYKLTDEKFKVAAGWLIEQCGWKGKIIGNVATWKNQALVIVNYNNASGKEIFDFSTQIINSVEEQFSITLEREVNIL